MLYVEAQTREERERENRRAHFTFPSSYSRDAFQNAEDRFSKNPVSTPAMEAAVAAFQLHVTKENPMSQEITIQKSKNKIELGDIESVFIKGDISCMNEVQRVEYTREVCRSLGLNPLTNPFDYISFQGKIQLYAKKGCTDQLRGLYNISISIVSQEIFDGVLTVTARAKFPDGREDEDIGAVSVQGLKGDALCNAKMKAVTKAKRRVTLSICGLGMMDDSETDSIPGAVKGEKVFTQPSPTSLQTPKSPSDAQLERLYAISHDSGIPRDRVKFLMKEHYGINSSKELNLVQYKEVCDWLIAQKASAVVAPKEAAAKIETENDIEAWDAIEMDEREAR